MEARGKSFATASRLPSQSRTPMLELYLFGRNYFAAARVKKDLCYIFPRALYKALPIQYLRRV